MSPATKKQEGTSTTNKKVHTKKQEVMLCHYTTRNVAVCQEILTGA